MATSRPRQLAAHIFSRLMHPDNPAGEIEEEGDLTYETALLNLEIRSFLHSEYDAQEPPPDAFQRLMRSIEPHEEARKAESNDRITWVMRGRHAAQAWGSCLDSIGAFLSNAARSGVPRLVSSGLVAMLVVMAMWPRMMSTLNTNSPTYSSSLLAAGSSIPRDLAGQDFKHGPIRQSVPPAGQTTFLPGNAPLYPPSSEVQPGSISPGLEYDQPSVWVEQHLGEYLDSASHPAPYPEMQSAQGQGDGLSPLCAPNRVCSK